MQKDLAIRQLQTELQSFATLRGTIARVLRWAAAALLIGAAAGGSALSIATCVIDAKLPIALVISGAFALTVAGIAVAFNRRMAWQIAGAVALFLGVVAAIYEISSKTTCG